MGTAGVTGNMGGAAAATGPSKGRPVCGTPWANSNETGGKGFGVTGTAGKAVTAGKCGKGAGSPRGVTRTCGSGSESASLEAVVS